jgi:glycosyltransferase involved in cell wall biosynthesis
VTDGEQPTRWRVAVYDAFWATAGGGETYAGGVAEVLSRDHDVTLLGHEPVDPVRLGERLGLDLSAVSTRVVDDCSLLEVETRDFDLLVNASFRSHGLNGATHGIYVVHFPDRPGAEMAGWQRALNRAGSVVRRGRSDALRIQGGFHPPDLIRWQEVRWTNGDGHITVDRRPGRDEVLQLWFGRYLPDATPRTVTVLVDGEERARAVIAPPASRWQVVLPLRLDVPLAGSSRSAEVRIQSVTSRPHDTLGNGDRRSVGVPLVGATLGGGARSALVGTVSLLVAEPPGTAWLDSYDLVVANSAFTQRWIERWWGRASTVLEPPVPLRAPGEKEPVILSVGRFFAPGRGHAKKQLEMVQAFRQLVDGGLTGWELHMVGGCAPEDEPYFEQVAAAAAGLPVRLHRDATGAELDALYARASIFWHATGLGEDLEADPGRAEHFGIATAEAMSAGAVPVVLAAGGQPEVVEAGVSGLLFDDLDGLVSATATLVDDPARLRQLSRGAIAASQRFGKEAFAARLREIVDDLFRR